MYIHALSAFTEYLCDVRRSLDDIARFLILNTFKSMQDLQIYAIYIGKIENDGSLVLKSSFGFESKYLDQWQRIPLVKKLPITESITNEIKY